jgi:hypothetical protein
MLTSNILAVAEKSGRSAVDYVACGSFGSGLSSFEIDMLYKRIREKKMNEVVFTTYLRSHRKSKYFLSTCQVPPN